MAFLLLMILMRLLMKNQKYQKMERLGLFYPNQDIVLIISPYIMKKKE